MFKIERGNILRNSIPKITGMENISKGNFPEEFLVYFMWKYPHEKHIIYGVKILHKK